MKTIKLIVSILFFATFFSFSTFANNVMPKVGLKEAANELRKEVANLIQSPGLKDHNILNAEVYLKFTINPQREIIVLKVTTDNSYLENFVKERLNYRQIETNGLDIGATYNLTILFTLQ